MIPISGLRRKASAAITEQVKRLVCRLHDCNDIGLKRKARKSHAEMLGLRVFTRRIDRIFFCSLYTGSCGSAALRPSVPVSEKSCPPHFVPLRKIFFILSSCPVSAFVDLTYIKMSTHHGKISQLLLLQSLPGRTLPI